MEERNEGALRTGRFDSGSFCAHDNVNTHRLSTLLWRQINNPLLLLLLLTCLVSYWVGELADSYLMGAVLLGSIALSFVQEYRAMVTMNSLHQQLCSKATVSRKGIRVQIPSDEVVVGDQVFLAAGDLIPADGILLSAKGLFVSEALLTGESMPVEKSLESNVPEVYMGTSVRSGVATMLATRVGAVTKLGALISSLRQTQSETVFEKELKRFGWLLALVMSLCLGILMISQLLLGRPFLSTLLFALAIAVSMSPQLLPAIMSILLSRGCRELSRHGVLVKRLNAIENLGLLNVLCADKTGTLTTGVIQVQSVVDLNGNRSDELAKWAYLNVKLQSGLQNPIDKAIKMYGESHNLETEHYQKIDELPFDSFRKRLTVIARQAGSENDKMICQGAIEKLLEVCAVNPTERQRIQELAKRFASQGSRVLGIALKSVPQKSSYRLHDEKSLVFSGIIALSDEVKEETIETISSLAKLGVNLKMITGDNRFSARLMANQIHLTNCEPVTGEQIAVMTEKDLAQAVQKFQVFAEVDPQQKALIVRVLQQTGARVGFLGDGINDAVALQVADVGISVQSAADIALETSDIVLVQSGLKILHQGILLGRRIFANTKKYILITSSANFGNMLSLALASMFLPFLPLLPFQVLFINVLTDIPTLLIGTDYVEPRQLYHHQTLKLNVVIRYMISLGGLSSLADIITFFVLQNGFRVTLPEFRSGWFLVCVLTELATIFIVRTPQWFFQSKPSRPLVLSSLLVAQFTLLISTPKLGWTLIGTLLGITATFLLLAELLKKFNLLHDRSTDG